MASAPGNEPTDLRFDVRLDIDTAGRQEIVDALIAVGCGRRAAEVLAATLKPVPSGPTGRSHDDRRRTSVPARCRQGRPAGR